VNRGTIKVHTGSIFLFAGVLNNPGTISLYDTSSGAVFRLEGDTTLKGGGLFSLSDTPHNRIECVGALTNVDNTIQGAGTIDVPVINESGGSIVASSGANPFVLDKSVTNFGILKSTGAGGLTLDGNVVTNVVSAPGQPNILAGAGTTVKLINGAEIVGGILAGDFSTAPIHVVLGSFDGSGTHPVENFTDVIVDGTLSTEGVIDNWPRWT
jgi:hypothetical protein